MLARRLLHLVDDAERSLADRAADIAAQPVRHRDLAYRLDETDTEPRREVGRRDVARGAMRKPLGFVLAKRPSQYEFADAVEVRGMQSSHDLPLQSPLLKRS